MKHLAYLEEKKKAALSEVPKIALKRKRREILSDLKLIFEEVCSLGESDVKHSMNGNKLYRLLRDCKILDKTVNSTYIDLLYKKIVNADNVEKGGLSYDDFVQALREIAGRR